MDPAEHVAAIRHDGEALITASEGIPAAQVPTTPDWDVESLVRHVGGVHRWCAAIVRSNEAIRRRDIGRPADGIPFDALAAWYREGLAVLCSTLSDADPAAETWTFSSRAPQPVGWWHRRMAVETAVHRWDVQHAAGPAAAEPIAAGVAAEGITEHLTDFLPGALERAGVELSGTLHLHATDGHDGEWLVDFDASPPAVTAGHSKAGTAVRGPVSDLLLWLWNRLAGGGARLEVFGSAVPVTVWPRLTL